LPDGPTDLPAGFAPWPRTSPFGEVSLSIDFMAPVAVGQLLTATPQVLRIGSRLAHATAVLLADGASVARASATLAVVRRGEPSKPTAAA
jgi:acyl-coenzyme A thioesterase PaaI-like protein